VIRDLFLFLILGYLYDHSEVHTLTLLLDNISEIHSMSHTHTQPFYGSVEFVRDNPGEPVPFNVSTMLIMFHFIL